MTRLALFASGSGTNVENIVRHFESNKEVEIVKIYCNKPNAYVLERADYLGIDSRVFTKTELQDGTIAKELQADEIDLVILAGFLLLVPQNLTQTFENRIINVHPSLLPKYGGKGMYGHHVHEAVIAHKESESGITIHLVNEVYDDGRILFQAKTPIVSGDNAETLAAKIHALEKRHFPQVIATYIQETKAAS